MNQSIFSLKQALPYLRLYKDKTFVVKIGGEILAHPDALDNLAEQIGLLSGFGIRLVIVHGGGPQASDLSRRLGLKPELVAGRRITDDGVLEVAKMVYRGKLNIELAAVLNRHGVKAVGLSGADAGMIAASRRPPVPVRDDDGVERVVDFGHVGDIQRVDTALPGTLLENGFVPVVCSLGLGEKGEVFNINADGVAEALAVALKAKKLIFITRKRGVLRNQDDETTLVPFADPNDIALLMRNGGIAGGMRPKIEACLRAAANGVKRTHIISGLIPDTLLTEVFSGEGCGTMIVAEREKQAYKEQELG